MLPALIRKYTTPEDRSLLLAMARDDFRGHIAFSYGSIKNVPRSEWESQKKILSAMYRDKMYSFVTQKINTRISDLTLDT